MIGYGWGNVCYIVNFPLGEYLLYSKVFGGKVDYIANIPRGIETHSGEGLPCGRFTIQHRNSFCSLIQNNIQNRIMQSNRFRQHDIFEKCEILMHVMTNFKHDAPLVFSGKVGWSWVIVLNTTFNINSAISWRSVVLVDATGISGENHRPVASH